MRKVMERSERDPGFRARLLADAKREINAEFGIDIPDGHSIEVHESDKYHSHLVIPPASPISEEEREAARTGAASLSFLKRTMHDPAPPRRPFTTEFLNHGSEKIRRPTELLPLARSAIRKGLDFLNFAIDDRGAWPCIRYNIADDKIPRHYERPAFVSAYCHLALRGSGEPLAQDICARTQDYIVELMEYPGLWRYYRHLPQDLDSTTTCSLVIADHPWIRFGGNVPRILSNRDENGRFLTWLLALGEPDVTAKFRIEADPVVNANVIALLGDCPETRPAQAWLEKILTNGKIADSSKWYPDTVAVCYSVARAIALVGPVLDHLISPLAQIIKTSRDEYGHFDHVLQTAQAVSALAAIGELEGLDDIACQTENLLRHQFEDGAWPELLAFGDQKLMWGSVGQIGHASEAMTTAFCIEALECLTRVLEIYTTSSQNQVAC